MSRRRRCVGPLPPDVNFASTAFATLTLFGNPDPYNHAIESRYGAEEQEKTFMMSNIAPQSPVLNRGVWRNVEHRIADL